MSEEMSVNSKNQGEVKQEESGKMISRRNLLAAIGMAGAVITAQTVLNGSTAYGKEKSGTDEDNGGKMKNSDHQLLSNRNAINAHPAGSISVSLLGGASGNVQELADIVGRLQGLEADFHLNDLTELLGRSTTDLVSGATSLVFGYHPGWSSTIAGPTGGGIFYWDAVRSKSQHNGGTIISPTVPWNGEQSTLGAFLAGTGETIPAGSGCWVRSYSGSLNVLWFGAVGDGTTDNSAAIQSAVSVSSLVFPVGNVFSLTADIHIPSNRNIFVESGAALINNGGRFTSYDTNNVIWQIEGVVSSVAMRTAPGKIGWPSTAAGDGAGDERGFIEFGASTQVNSAMKNFRVYGNGKVTGDWAGTPNASNVPRLVNRKGIAAWNCSNVLVQGIEVSGFEGEAVYWRGNTQDYVDIVFDRLYVHDCGFNGVNINTTGSWKGLKITNCRVMNTFTGIESSGGDIEDNYILNTVYTGILFGFGSGHGPMHVCRNTVENCGETSYSLGFFNSPNFPTGTVYDVIISGNHAVNSGGYSYMLSNISAFNLQGNTSRGHGKLSSGWAYRVINCSMGFVDGNITATPGAFSAGDLSINGTDIEIGKNPVLLGGGTPATVIGGGVCFGGKYASATGYGNRENQLIAWSSDFNAVGTGAEIAFKNGYAGAPVYASITGVGAAYDANGSSGGIVIATKKATTGATLQESLRVDEDGTLAPGADNTQPLGLPYKRFSELRAGTATISTSDEREKQQIKPIDDAALSAWAEVDYLQYKFKDAVESKGREARWHFGVVAQRVQAAFESKGLNAFEYGLLCYDEWDALPDVRDEQGTLITPARKAGSRYGIRYEEALCLEAALMRQEINRLKGRV